MNIEAKKEYETLLEKATTDPRVLGVVLVGSQARENGNEHSDYDVVLISTDESFEDIKMEYGKKTDMLDVMPHSITEFREFAGMGSRREYDRYTFSHAKTIIDKNAQIAILVKEKGFLPADHTEKKAGDALRGYLNSLHRSLKSVRDGNDLGLRLNASETVPRILTFVFALERRMRPFNRELEWELKTYPLQKLPLSSGEFLEKIKKIVETADPIVQKEILVMIQKMAKDNGFDDILASWGGYYFG